MQCCNAPIFKSLPWKNIVVSQTNDLIMPVYKDFWLLKLNDCNTWHNFANPCIKTIKGTQGVTKLSFHCNNCFSNVSVIDCRFRVEMYMCYYTYSGCGDRGKGAGQPLTGKSKTYSTYRARCPSLSPSIIHPFSLPPTVTLTFTSYCFFGSENGCVSKHMCVCLLF